MNNKNRTRYVSSPLRLSMSDEKYASIKNHCKAQFCSPASACIGFYCSQINEVVKKFEQISHIPSHTPKSTPRSEYKSIEHRRPRKHCPEL